MRRTMMVTALLVAQCSHPAYAGGSQETWGPRVAREHAPRPVTLPALPSPVLAAPVMSAAPVPTVGAPLPSCDDYRQVLSGREDLYKNGCRYVPNFGSTAEPSRHDDVSPN